MPRLILLRHAQAEPPRTDDHARVLTSAGHAEAAALRPLLAELAVDLAVDVAVVSTAARTRETWALADPGGVEAVFDARVYEASVADLREVLGELTAGCAVLVGHNPSVERLAWALQPCDETNRGMRTGGMAVFEVDDWTLAGARLTQFR